jgi:hypothetical protein
MCVNGVAISAISGWPGLQWLDGWSWQWPLQKAAKHWKQLAKVTEPVYVEMPLSRVYRFDQNDKEDTRSFHWKKLLPAVNQELKQVESLVGNVE